MAVVKLGNKVKTNLPDMIRYVINPEKNDGGRLVYASYSSERHDANMLAEPMIRDLERCANGLRKDGVLALHLKHSFSPDEHVNAEQVHELGVMLTEAITGGDYKYVVSPHMDRHHLHNHIVICAANRRTGRKMRLTRRSIDQWRAVSDELCRREGLAVLENPKVKTAESRVRDERERLKNERKRIREDIAKQVERESERMRRRLKESSDRQRERDKRILFACAWVCARPWCRCSPSSCKDAGKPSPTRCSTGFVCVGGSSRWSANGLRISMRGWMRSSRADGGIGHSCFCSCCYWQPWSAACLCS